MGNTTVRHRGFEIVRGLCALVEFGLLVGDAAAIGLPELP
jgi:hypothetical protein